MTTKIFAGLRNISKIVEANSQWWMLEIFDGFGAHLYSLKYAQVRRKHKILSLKEGGDLLQANQAYNRFVAKGGGNGKDGDYGHDA